MTKVRETLRAVAQEVAARFAGTPGELVQTQIDAAIAANAREKFFTAEDETLLIQLRSQLFKSPHKKLRF